jgi:hypothetical protein
VDRGPATGLFVGKPGVPPEIVSKANAYAEWMSGFMGNPMKMITAMLEDRDKAIEERGDARLREIQEHQGRYDTIMAIAAQNAPWFYAQGVYEKPHRGGIVKLGA